MTRNLSPRPTRYLKIVMDNEKIMRAKMGVPLETIAAEYELLGSRALQTAAQLRSMLAEKGRKK